MLAFPIALHASLPFHDAITSRSLVLGQFSSETSIHKNAFSVWKRLFIYRNPPKNFPHENRYLFLTTAGDNKPLRSTGHPWSHHWSPGPWPGEMIPQCIYQVGMTPLTSVTHSIQKHTKNQLPPHSFPDTTGRASTPLLRWFKSYVQRLVGTDPGCIVNLKYRIPWIARKL